MQRGMLRLFLAASSLWTLAGAATGMELIAHAGGSLNGKTYLNSIAALDANYARGFRSFEVDLQRTSDGEIVCVHDWSDWHFLRWSSGPLSLADWLSEPARGCTLAELAAWMQAHQDARLITDTKSTDLGIISAIGDTIAKSQLIVQAYSLEMAEAIVSNGYSVIFTQYLLPHSQRVPGALPPSLARGLHAVTLPADGTDWAAWKGWTASPIYSHTINDCRLARDLQAIGVDGLYTDDIVPGDCKLS